jgi:MoxR-like ATPase
MRKSKRLISKAKMYGFNPWVDQLDAINQIVAETGERESTILRKLVDEALAARRRKIAEAGLAESPSGQGFSETLQTIQTLLLKLVRQGETSLRMQDVSLALLQDTLAEARAGRRAAWEQGVPALKEEGLSSSEIGKCFEAETDEAKDFAYSAAQEIKKQQRET